MYKIISRLIRIFLLVYIGFGAYLYFVQNKFMYFPVAEYHTDRIQFEFFTSDKEHLKIWSINPGMNKAVIYFGGNAENVAYNADDLSRILPDHSIYLVNYRGYGGSTGSPSETGFFTDALNIYDTLQERHENISVIGRSLGSSIALYLSSKRPVERLVLATPYDSALSLASKMYPVYPVGLLLRDKYDNIKYAAETKASTLILIAKNDKVIPFQHSVRLAKAFPGEQVDVVIVNKSGHNDISARKAYWETMGQFLLRQIHPATGLH